MKYVRDVWFGPRNWTPPKREKRPIPKVDLSRSPRKLLRTPEDDDAE